jgi:hypothetical protein
MKEVDGKNEWQLTERLNDWKRIQGCQSACDEGEEKT